MSDGLFQLTDAQRKHIEERAEREMPPEMKDLLKRADNYLNKVKQSNMAGINLISQECFNQRINHGHTIQKDFEENMNGQLVQAAQALLEGDIEWMPKSWDNEICKKLISKPFKERLVIAGALIAAEIDRAEFEKEQNKKV